MAGFKVKKGIKIAVLAGVFALILAVAACLLVWNINEFSIDLQLKGQPQVVVEYGSDYQDPGAAAFFSGTILQQEPIALQVAVSGQVDTGVLGDHVLTYTAEHDGYSSVTSRTVRVVDTVAPQIQLQTVEGSYTLPGQKYEEEGFIATDNHDGDITDRVKSWEDKGVVKYWVKDSSGNEVQVERTIFYDDPIAPELTLLGESSVTITAGDTYKEPGYTAADNCDGDLTDKVQVTTDLNNKTAGTYTITYTVADGYGNTISATRTVVVKAKPVYSSSSSSSSSSSNVNYGLPDEQMPPNGKVICLTFDDGPSKYTDKLLEILKKYNVKATFFVVNTGYVSRIARIAEEGHVVAIHSATHNFNKVYTSEEAYFKDLYKMQDVIYQYTGTKPMILRFPGGASNTISRYNPGIMTRLTKEVKARGFRYFDWNVDSKDAGGAKSADEVYRNVIRGIGNKKFSVVLQHDSQGFSVNAVERIIQWGLAWGYTFDVLRMDSPTCEHSVNN